MAKTTPPHSTNGAHEVHSMIQPEAVFETYGKFVQQIETANRQWIGSMRQSAEAGWDFATQMTGSVFADARRISDFYFRLYEMDLTTATAAMRHMGTETSAATSRHFSAIQRSAAAAE